jgi:hypothetical protein
MMKKRIVIIILSIVAVMVGLVATFTFVKPIDVFISEIDICHDPDGEYNLLLMYYGGYDFSDDKEIDESIFPSNRNEDYTRINVKFAAKSRSVLKLSQPYVVVTDGSEECERLIWYTDAYNIEDEVSDTSTCNMTMFFYTAGMSDAEIKEYIKTSLSALEFNYSYQQKYIGVKEEILSFNNKKIEKISWGVFE